MSEGNYYQTKESVEEYIGMAKDVNSISLIQKLREYLPANSSLLELGTGPGTDWEILSQDYNVAGSDFSEEFLIRLRENYPQGNFQQLDASTRLIDSTFIGIYSNKVLQHLTDQQLANSVDRQIEILSSGGVVCHSFWKGNGSEEFKGMLVNYQTEDSIRELFGTRFEILLIESYQEFEKDDSIVFIGRKKQI